MAIFSRETVCDSVSSNVKETLGGVYFFHVLSPNTTVFQTLFDSINQARKNTETSQCIGEGQASLKQLSDGMPC